MNGWAPSRRTFTYLGLSVTSPLRHAVFPTSVCSNQTYSSFATTTRSELWNRQLTRAVVASSPSFGPTLSPRLLWNPESEVEPIIDDFMYGYYGRAGQYIGLTSICYTAESRLRPTSTWACSTMTSFLRRFRPSGRSPLSQADAVADTQEIRERVELALLPVLYLKCKRAPHCQAGRSYERFCAIVSAKGNSLRRVREAHRKAFHAAVEAAN